MKNFSTFRKLISLLSFVIAGSLTGQAVIAQTIFIVRHAEKTTSDNGLNMSRTDPPLTSAGEARARALLDSLRDDKIGYVFSTPTARTRATAEPTAHYFGLQPILYAAPDTAFISKLGSVDKNALVVGHSNTVDDIVNLLCGKEVVPEDLPDSSYDNLFVVTKKDNHWVFENKKYGKKSR